MFPIIQILLFDTDLNCVVLAAAYAVVPSRTNLSLVAVLCRYKAAFRIELINSHTYYSEFLNARITAKLFLKQDISISHLTQNESLAFPR